jgi:hypothetical protein
LDRQDEHTACDIATGGDHEEVRRLAGRIKTHTRLPRVTLKLAWQETRSGKNHATFA